KAVGRLPTPGGGVPAASRFEGATVPGPSPFCHADERYPPMMFADRPRGPIATGTRGLVNRCFPFLVAALCMVAASAGHAQSGDIAVPGRAVVPENVASTADGTIYV